MSENYHRNFDHGGLYVPDDPKIYQELRKMIDDAYRSLPLEGCKIESDILKGGYYIVPPAGKAFELRGDLTEVLEGAHVEDYYQPPQYPDVFVGSGLRVDGAITHKRELKVTIHVIGQAEMWHDSATLPIALPIADSDEKRVYLADIKSHLHWVRPIAGSPADFSSMVRVIDEPAQFRELQLAKDRSRIDPTVLWRPEKDDVTSKDYMEAYYADSRMSKENLERCRIAEMRARRAEGRPFADDECRDVKIGNPLLMDYYTGQKTLRQIIKPRDPRINLVTPDRYDVPPSCDWSWETMSCTCVLEADAVPHDLLWEPGYPSGLVVDGILNALNRYVGRETTPSDVKKAQNPFNSDGTLKGQSDTFFQQGPEETDDKYMRLRAELYNVGSALFYLEP